jgi:hypothetical protein
VRGHLTPEIVFGFEHALLSPEELRAAYEHVQECGECRNRLAQSLDIEGMLSSAAPEPKRRSYLPYAAAAAVVLVAALSGWFWFHSQIRPKPLTAASIELPAFIPELNPPHQILMGEPAAPAAGEMSPQGTAVLASRPTFRWLQEAGEGWTYQVKIFGPASDLVLESAETRATQWKPDQDLASGVNYQWQVTATRGTERLTLPRLPSTPPRFRVIAPAEARRLAELSARGASHLELTSAYAQAGLLNEARTELEGAIRDHPDDQNLRRLRDQLR